MATNSPPPNSSPTASPPSPSSNTSPPPSSQSSSPPPTTSFPPQPNANPSGSSSPSTPSPPAQPPVSPPPPQIASTPPITSTPSPPLPQQTIAPTPTPPVSSPPPSSPPPPPTVSTPTISPPPPPLVSSPSPSSPPPPPTVSTPTSSPPPPPLVSSPSPSSPPPPTPVTRQSPSSPPPPPPKSSSSPPAPANPPQSFPPPPKSSRSPPAPPQSFPPPPKSSRSPPAPANPSQSSPPPPSPPSDPRSPTPESSPPPSPASKPSSPPTPNASAPPSQTPSTSNSSSNSPPPPTSVRVTPPPPQIGVSPNANNSSPISPESSNPPSNGISTAGLVAIGVAVGIIALSLIGLVVWCLRKRRKEVTGLHGVYIMPSPLGSSPRSDSTLTKTTASAPLIRSGGSSSDLVYSPKEPGGLGYSRSLFTYEELLKATDEFSAQNLLGEGGFGSVYKGFLPDGREVAIKQLKIGGGQGDREFKAEVEIISRIHHRHLVSLVGYCISENRRLLIYDYIPNNTLYFHLHGRPVLDWAKRVKIAAGAARGIAYLHEDCHPRIIHRDIKSSNILLDNNFEARVSDFGLAKLALDANTHVSTRVVGTFGYMAPEYASSGKLTEKSDVFSFGVVLLELITGRKPVDASQPLGDESLVEWARPLLSNALDNEEFDALVDPKLGKDYVESEMFRMIEAAAACVRHSAAKRPSMGQVVRAFDSLATSDLSNGMRVGESEIYNSAQQSAEIRWFRRMAFGSQNYSTDFFSEGSGVS